MTPELRNALGNQVRIRFATSLFPMRRSTIRSFSNPPRESVNYERLRILKTGLFQGRKCRVVAGLARTIRPPCWILSPPGVNLFALSTARR